ncbi:hypothetical protein P7C70_g5221, partial [Phenoliferia sp. Uapishka_3]
MFYWDRYKSDQARTLEILVHHMDDFYTSNQIYYKIANVEATLRFIMPYLKETGSGHGNRDEGKEFDFDKEYTESRVLGVYHAEWFNDFYDMLKAKPNVSPVAIGASTGAVVLSKDERALLGMEPADSGTESDSVVASGSDKQALKDINKKKASKASKGSDATDLMRDRGKDEGGKGEKRLQKRKKAEAEMKRRRAKRAGDGESDDEASDKETASDRLSRHATELLSNVSTSTKLRDTRRAQESVRLAIREAMDVLEKRIDRVARMKDVGYEERLEDLKKKLAAKEDEYDQFL